jgi:hypothetical protein
MTAIDTFHGYTEMLNHEYEQSHAGPSIAARGWQWAVWLLLKMSYPVIVRRTDQGLPVSGGPALWTVDERARES